MRYLDIKEFDLNNGEGIRVSLWVSGCDFRCPSCHNVEAWDRNSGKEFTNETKKYIFDLVEKDISKDLSILGGEPLATYNRYGVLELCQEFKYRYPNKSIWLWSGYKKEDVEVFFPKILEYIDVLIDGLYVEELKDENLEWRGSSNQKVYVLK